MSRNRKIKSTLEKNINGFYRQRHEIKPVGKGLQIILLSLLRMSHGLVRLNYLNASSNFIFGKKYWVQASPSLPLTLCLSFICIELMNK